MTARLSPERRLRLRLAYSAVPTVGIWKLASLSNVSHQTLYGIIGPLRPMGLVEALPLLRLKYSLESGTTGFGEWLQALTTELSSAFITVRSALPEGQRPPVQKLTVGDLDYVLEEHAIEPDEVEQRLMTVVARYQTHFDELGRLIAAAKRGMQDGRAA